MKKTILLCSAIFAATLGFVIAAEEKESSEAKGTDKAAPTLEHKIFAPSELKWTDAPPGLPAGGKIAVLDGDPTKPGSFTMRLQTPDGYKIMPHTHPSAEHVTVISGMLHLGMGDKFDESAGRQLDPGGFAVMPAGMKHFAWMTGETVVQIHGTGPFQIKYVNPADDPRNAKK